MIRIIGLGFIFILGWIQVVLAQNVIDFKQFQYAKTLFRDKLFDQSAVEFQEFYQKNNHNSYADSALFMAALSYAHDQQYSQALLFFNNYLTFYGQSYLAPRALHELGRVYASQGQSDVAVDLWMSIPKKYPVSEWAETGMMAALQTRAQALNIEESFAIAQAYRALYPRGTYLRQMQFIVARQLRMNQQYSQALTALQIVLQSSSTDSLYLGALWEKAYILKQLGELKTAHADSRLLVERSNSDLPIHRSALALKSELEMDQYFFTEAASSLGKLIRLDPFSLETARALHKMDRYQQIQLLAPACSPLPPLKNFNDLNLFYLAKSLLLNQRPDSALKALERIEVKSLFEEETAQYPFIKYEAYLALHRQLEAEQALWEGLNASLGEAVKSRLAGQALEFQISQAQPLPIIKNTLRFFESNKIPLTARHYLECARYCEKMNDWTGALTLWQTIIEKYPYDQTVLTARSALAKLQSLYLPEFIPPEYYMLQTQSPSFARGLIAFYNREFKIAAQIIRPLIKENLDNRFIAELMVKTYTYGTLKKSWTLEETRVAMEELAGFFPAFRETIDYYRLQIEPKQEDFVEFLGLYPSSSFLQNVRLQQAKYFCEKNEYREAWSAIAPYCKTAPSGSISAQILLYGALSATRSANYVDARRLWEGYLQSPDSAIEYPFAQYEYISCLIALDDHSRAYAEAQRFFPRYVDAAGISQRLTALKIELAQSALKERHYDQVRLILENLSLHNQYQLLMGRLYLEQDMYAQSIECLAKIGENDSLYAQARFYQGLAYSASFLENQAIEAFSAAVGASGHNPRRVDARLKLAELYLKNDLELLASNQLAALEQDTLSADNRFDATVLKLKLAILKNEAAKVQKEVAQLRKDYPQKQTVYYELMNEICAAYINKKNLSKAEDIVKDLLDDAAAPPMEKIRAQKNKGVILFNRDKFTESVSTLLAAKNQAPSSNLLAEICFSLSTAYYYGEPRNVMGTIENYEQITRLQNVHPTILSETWFNLGTVYEENKQFAQAVVAYQNLIRDFPDHPRAVRARFRIGYCYYSTFRYPEAISVYQQMIPSVKGEDAAELHYYLGDCYYKNGEFVSAIQQFLIVAYEYNEFPMFAVTALYMTGEIYQRHGERDKAIMIYDKIVKKFGAESQYGQMAAQRLLEMSHE